VYRTPQVVVLEMKDGKIKKGRHYCDPDTSFFNLTEEQIRRLLFLNEACALVPLSPPHVIRDK